MSDSESAPKLGNRREFLGAAALGAGLAAATTTSAAAERSALAAGRSAADLEIVRVQAFALSYPGEFAYGSVRKPNQEAGTYFEVETASGLVGHGISAISDPRAVANLTNQLVAPAVVGENAMDHEAIWSKLYWRLTPRGQTGLATHAISGVDIALWDQAPGSGSSPIGMRSARSR